MEAPSPLELLTLPPWAERAAAPAVARDLVDIGGSATADDVRAVNEELARLPPRALELLRASGVRIVVCRGAVTDYLPELAGEREPKHHRPYDELGGMYLPERHEVVIATGGHDTRYGSNVSATPVAHEVFHAIDDTVPGVEMSASPAFVAAWEADRPGLDHYLREWEDEAFAQSAARFYLGNDPDFAAKHPNLNAYWAGDPLGLKR
jgi:hypothetical protein